MLYRSQHRVKDEHGKDDDGALRVAREHRDHRSHNEDDHQQVFELLQKHLPHRLFSLLPQGVWTNFFYAFLGLLGGKALLLALHGVENLLRGLSIILGLHGPISPFFLLRLFAA